MVKNWQVLKILRRYLKLDPNVKFSASYHHVLLYKYYKVRPFGDSDPFETDTTYCFYDDTHNDYVYTREWIEFLSKELSPDFSTKLNSIKENVKD